jgi:hypothetical protein
MPPSQAPNNHLRDFQPHRETKAITAKAPQNEWVTGGCNIIFWFVSAIQIVGASIRQFVRIKERLLTVPGLT